MAQGAYIEAIRQLKKGLELVEDLPADRKRSTMEIALRVALGVPLLSRLGGASAEAEKNYLRAHELCHEAGDDKSLFIVTWGLWVGALLRSDMHRMSRLADQLLELAEKQNDTAYKLEAHHCQWSGRLLVGKPGLALQHAEEGIRLYRREEHHRLAYIYGGHDPGTCCRNISGLALGVMGFPEQARERLDAGSPSLGRSRTLGHARRYAQHVHPAGDHASR